ncbi:hypothetical protein TNCV_2319941 [Trichonephila clavipes]|nr:hypothetical protein TNCV_2319941 [Trichonephila clavipes]
MKYKVELQRTFLSHPVAVEDILPNSKLVLAENGRGISDFPLTLYKRSDDLHTCLASLVLNSDVLASTFKMISFRLGLGAALRRPPSCLMTWDERVSRS